MDWRASPTANRWNWSPASGTSPPPAVRRRIIDLRRLRRTALISRLPGRHADRLTPFGRRVAVLFTTAHARVLAPGLALFDPLVPADSDQRRPLVKAWPQLDLALNPFVDRQLLAA
jgi:hypothetical protein